jgi:ribosomal protein L37AE/L43A
MKENGKTVKCPRCGSKNVKPVLNFDYWKQCKDCGKEFMTNCHN